MFSGFWLRGMTATPRCMFHFRQTYKYSQAVTWPGCCILVNNLLNLLCITGIHMNHHKTSANPYKLSAWHVLSPLPDRLLISKVNYMQLITELS